MGLVCTAIATSLACATAEQTTTEQPSVDPDTAAVAADAEAVANPSETKTLSAGEPWVEPESGMAFRYIPPGVWMMGSPADETGRRETEELHEVTLTRGFWMGETEVTQQQWQELMGSNPAHFDRCGANCPVESVNWIDALEFSNALSKRAGLTECYVMDNVGVDFAGLDCDGFRLPSEAEWEWAARAGTKTVLYSGGLTIAGAGNGPELDPVAWYGGNSGVEYEGGEDCSGWKETHHPAQQCGTHPVGQKKPNPWFLYDMLGNVWEWTWDATGSFTADAVTDPLVAAKQAGRMVRGCAWDSGARACRVANRGMNTTRIRSKVIGLRLVRTDIGSVEVPAP